MRTKIVKFIFIQFFQYFSQCDQIYHISGQNYSAQYFLNLKTKTLSLDFQNSQSISSLQTIQVNGTK